MQDFKDSPFTTTDLIKTHFLKIYMNNEDKKISVNELKRLELLIKQTLNALEYSTGKLELDGYSKVLFFIEGRLAFINHFIKNHLGLFKANKDLGLTWTKDLIEILKFIDLLKSKYKNQQEQVDDKKLPLDKKAKIVEEKKPLEVNDNKLVEEKKSENVKKVKNISNQKSSEPSINNNSVKSAMENVTPVNKVKNN